MKAQKAILSITVLLLLIIPSVSAQALYFGYGTPTKAKHVVQCLLGIIEKATPYIMLALIVLAGIKWVASGTNRQDRIMAKKYIEMAIVGFVCVACLLAIADYMGMPAEYCVQDDPPTDWPTPGPDPFLIEPSSTLTG